MRGAVSLLGVWWKCQAGHLGWGEGPPSTQPGENVQGQDTRIVGLPLQLRACIRKRNLCSVHHGYS